MAALPIRVTALYRPPRRAGSARSRLALATAKTYEKDKSWFAAAFQREQVLKSRPDDAAAKTLHAAAQGCLKKL
jgi:hypothetical protein